MAFPLRNIGFIVAADGYFSELVAITGFNAALFLGDDFAGPNDARAAAAWIGSIVAILIGFAGDAAVVGTFTTFKASVAVLIDPYGAFRTFRWKLFVGAKTRIDASITGGVFSFLERRADFIFATLRVRLTGQACSLKTTVVYGALIVVFAWCAIGDMNKGTYAIVAGVRGTDVVIIACLIVGAFTFAGEGVRVARRFLPAIRIGRAFHTDEFFGAGAAGTVTVLVALHACIRDGMALGTTAIGFV